MKKMLIFLVAMVLSSVGFAKDHVAKDQVAIFGGGCFWCVEADFDKLDGVKETISGYDGGQTVNPTYQYVSSGKSRYVEVVKIVYDPKVVSYKQLLTYYWQHIDPTVKDAQFCDKGAQYKSVIYYANNEQKALALASKYAVQKIFGSQKIYTEVLPSTTFYAAEEYHQNYYKKNPYRYKYYRWSCGRDKTVEEVWHDKSIK